MKGTLDQAGSTILGTTLIMDRQKTAPPEVRNVVNFLRNKAQMKTRTGILGGQRVEYFTRNAAIKAGLGPEFAQRYQVAHGSIEEE